jgi:hypothetical protein
MAIQWRFKLPSLIRAAKGSQPLSVMNGVVSVWKIETGLECGPKRRSIGVPKFSAT